MGVVSTSTHGTGSYLGLLRTPVVSIIIIGDEGKNTDRVEGRDHRP